jgi:hypothetical protein
MMLGFSFGNVSLRDEDTLPLRLPERVINVVEAFCLRQHDGLYPVEPDQTYCSDQAKGKHEAALRS